jgi:hypothetical protein
MGQKSSAQLEGSLRLGERRMKAVAKVLDYQTDGQLLHEVQPIADRKYGWGIVCPSR